MKRKGMLDGNIAIRYLKDDEDSDHQLGPKLQDDPLKVSQPSVEFHAALSSFDE